MRRFCMTLGGIAMCVRGSEPLEAGDALTPFLTADAAPELEITICPGGGPLPLPAEPLAGKDLLLYYYRTQEGLVCQSMGRFGPVSSVCWAPGRRRFAFDVNERDYPHIFETVEKVLQLFPVRRVLLERQAVLLHASQAVLNGRGILFTAPSGTGKTTQARLWRDTLGADIVCNDRVILRRHAEGWRSYGFPVDGDEPAGNWGVHRPAAIVGLLFDNQINALFYNYVSVAVALIVFGVLFILIEIKNKNLRPKVLRTEKLSFSTAFLIGLFQVIAAVFPGTSRSGATILGGLMLGVSRKVAAEFTFFLAVPVMFGASLLKLVKFGGSFTSTEIGLLAVGLIVAFVVSIVVIRFLMDYIKRHDFKVFGYYRIILGILVLCYAFLLARALRLLEATEEELKNAGRRKNKRSIGGQCDAVGQWIFAGCGRVF